MLVYQRVVYPDLQIYLHQETREQQLKGENSTLQEEARCADSKGPSFNHGLW